MTNAFLRKNGKRYILGSVRYIFEICFAVREIMHRFMLYFNYQN